MAVSDELVFAPLGGVGEIGMNLALYGFGPKRERAWLMVDFGMSFAGDEAPGVDLVLPDIRFLEAEKKNIVGLVITHGHEDHVGAVCWTSGHASQCPIYTTAFTAGLLEAKRAGEPGAPQSLPGDGGALGGAGAAGAVRGGVRAGRAFHSRQPRAGHSGRQRVSWFTRVTGSSIRPRWWGSPTDTARLAELGDEGVRAIVCDSTNAIRDGVLPLGTGRGWRR